MAARRPLLVLVPALALTLTACFGGSPAAEQSAAPQVSSGPVEIRYLIGQPEDAADLKLIKDDIKKFEAQSGGITVKLDVLPSENIRTVLQTQLRSGNGPDVFGYDTGPGFAGALAKAGLVHDLTGAYEKYNWPVYDFAKQRVTFDGKLVGIPSQMEEVGLFYNKDLFAKHGLAEPQNLGDLMAGATKLKEAGVIPIGVSDKEGWQGGHLLSMSLSSEVGSEGMDKLLAGETPWDDPSVVERPQGVADMAQQGLLTPSPTAVSYDNAQRAVLLRQGRDQPDRQLAGPGHRAQRQVRGRLHPVPGLERQGHLQRRPGLGHLHLGQQQEDRRRRASSSTTG